MASKKLRINSVASNNLQMVQQNGATIKGLVAVNTNAAARSIKFYDQTDAPTVGTSVPVLTVYLPATATTAPAFPYDGFYCKSTLWVAIVTGVADSDNTSVGAGDVLVTIGYD